MLVYIKKKYKRTEDLFYSKQDKTRTACYCINYSKFTAETFRSTKCDCNVKYYFFRFEYIF